MSETHKRLITSTKSSRRGIGLLVSLDCGHVRIMPYCSNRKLIKSGAYMVCKDCVERAAQREQQTGAERDE